MGLVVRLSRMIPLLIILAVAAAVIYIVVSFHRTPARAKEVLIAVFTWLLSGISVAFGVVALYALLEHNTAVLDLAVSFMVVGLVGLGITLVCKRVFIKHNPSYKDKAQRARLQRRWPWEAWKK